jgi:hypothetical protein
MKGGALYAPKKRSKTLSPLHKNKHPPIAKESPKRKKEHVYYTQICKEKETELRALDPQGRIFDFFSGHEILEKVTWHHPYGRTGDNYTDKEHMQPVIGKFHLMFHKQTVEKLEQQEWYADFLTRYKAFDENLWTKQTEKKLKNINPKLFNFDEDNQ